MEIFKKLLFLLTAHERKRLGLLLILTLTMALLEMIGIASIFPFMAVLTNPDLIETNVILNAMFQASKKFGVLNNQQFLFTLGVLLFVTLVISLAFKTLTTYVQVQFIQMLEYSIGKRLVEGYLYQPYGWFLNQNSADLGRTILSEVSQIIGGGIKPFIELISSGIVTIAIITLLFIADPRLSLIVGLSLSFIYFFIFYSIRNYLNQIGNRRLVSNQLRFITISEAFGAIKEIKVGGLEKSYVKLFSESAQNFARTQTFSEVIGKLPRYILEAVALGGILLIILYLMNQTTSFNNPLPIVSLYVFASFRLMPALQQIYVSFSQLAIVSPALNKLYDNLTNLKFFNKNQDQRVLFLNKTISLQNVYYNYPNSERTALKDINLIIHEKSTVGLIGATGSGKTTTVDIILGLLEPEKGTLEVDGKIITKQNVRSWQRSIGYVPQNIYLSDDTIAANIAFGVGDTNVNQDMVEKASKIANIHKFIIDELPKQYQTIIGERGVRLSGGQRQRIGIARALYHNPQVLILDEATSALDNQTEQAVMDAVNNLSKNITIIIIAHRLSTVKNCDIIFKLEKGHIIARGTFDEIID